MKFQSTLRAVEEFKKAISCAVCEKTGEPLQNVGNSCKHAFCWNCITTLSSGSSKRATRPMCPRCALPLNMNDVKDAALLNNCSNTLIELERLFEQFETSVTRKENIISFTQNVLQTLKVNENPRTIEEFLATQPAFEDVNMEMERTEDDKERSQSPELDIFAPQPISPVIVVEKPSTKRKRSNHLETPEVKKFKSEDHLFQTQVLTKNLDDDGITPFMTRRDRNFTDQYSYLNMNIPPLKSASHKIDIKKEEAFTKDIPLLRRSTTGAVRRSSRGFTPESPQFFGSSARKSEPISMKIENIDENLDRSNSSSPVGDIIENQEDRRNSIHLKRGEMVVINSILQDRIPQLVCAIKTGADINEKDIEGRTPLYLAVELKNKKAIEILMDAGAIVDASCGPSYETALHMAVRKQFYTIVDFLISRGASLQSRDIWQKTPVDLSRDDRQLRKIFEKYQSRKRIVNNVPPIRSKFFFVRLQDESYLTEKERKMLPGVVNLVHNRQPGTHLVVKTEKGCCSLNKENLTNILEALVKPLYLVSLSWITDSIAQQKCLDESKYEVRSLRLFEDGSVITDSALKWRRCSERMQPKLFAGCKFLFVAKKYQYLSRAEWEQTVTLGGGKACKRSPELSSDDPRPYHNQDVWPTFAVYNVHYPAPSNIEKNPMIRLVCEQWIIEAILNFSLKNPY